MAQERCARVAAEMGAGDLVATLRELNRQTSIPSLRDLNVPSDRYESLLEKMSADALAREPGQ
jgi:alcohol dehydrogenase class IV